MKYPFVIYLQGLDHRPIVAGLHGDPYIADLSVGNPMLDAIDVRDQQAYQKILEKEMQPDYHWGVAGYLENRQSLLRDCPQMVADGRFFHLGIDIILAKGTPICTPLDARVTETGYEEGEGNYGGYALLAHRSDRFDTFFSFYGHLERRRLPKPGEHIPAGAPFAYIGDFHENGNWFYHTHLQVLTERGMAAGYLSKGYCAEADLATIADFCPSPIPLFRR